jgi:hypothetical protein
LVCYLRGFINTLKDVDFKKLIPHLIAAGVLLAVAMFVFSANAFGDKVLRQFDNNQARGMQTEIQSYLKKGEPSPLWTNSAFGGMPAYQIYVKPQNDIIRPFVRAPFFWQDMSEVWSQVFAAMLLFYVLLQVLGVNWQIGIVGAIAYGITSYNMDILEAGHSTKMAALAFTPAMLAGAVLAVRGRYVYGLCILAFSTAAQVYVNHLQMTYYTLLLMGIYFLVALVEAIRGGTIANWAKAAGICAVAVALGFGTSAAKIWTTKEYGEETIRGKSELAAKSDKGDGLTKDYLFDWSCGVGESMTLLIPHYAGGGSNESLKDTKIYKQLPAEARRSAGAYLYTGDQPFVGTAIYYGAIVIFLFILGLFVVPNEYRWWFAIGGIFMVSLAWGKNFFLNDIWYDYMPMFKKFRAVTSAFGPGQLCFAALAALGLHHFMFGDGSNISTSEKKQKAIYIAAGITIGLCVIAWLMGAQSGARDEEIAAQNKQILDVIMADREALLRGDALRSIFFIAATAALLWAFARGIINSTITIGLVAVLAFADHYLVCTRTLTSADFESPKKNLDAPKPEAFDLKIQADKDIHYRVLDLARGGIAGNAANSYFHKSINGYHAAKLQRFQEVVEMYLGEKLNENTHILGMMNTKYIVTQKGDVIPNPDALGHAWFVNNVQTVADGDAELKALGALNPRDTVVVQAAAAAALGAAAPRDSTNKITLTAYHPDKMEYTYSASADQVTVFPEQYYPPAKGWKCYLNGQPYQDFVKANYMLRAIKLPAGQNQKFEMRFEPQSFKTGSMINLVASIAVLLLVAMAVWLYVRGLRSAV